MTDYAIRPWRKDEQAQLVELWKTGFGDDDACIARFFDTFLDDWNRDNTCLVAEADGKIVSAMYILQQDTWLNPYRMNRLTAGYAYALATLPEYRKQGIGTAVYKAVVDKILETRDCAMVLPSGPALYPFYEKASGAFPFSFRREAHFTAEELKDIPTVDAMRTEPMMYDGMREHLLGSMPHVTIPEDYTDFLAYQGCELYYLGSACALVEKIGDVCYIRELLAPNTDYMPHIATIASWCRAKEYVVYSPAFFDGPGEVKPYMLATMKEKPNYPLPDDLWGGFGME